MITFSTSFATASVTGLLLTSLAAISSENTCILPLAQKPNLALSVLTSSHADAIRGRGYRFLPESASIESLRRQGLVSPEGDIRMTLEQFDAYFGITPE